MNTQTTTEEKTMSTESVSYSDDSSSEGEIISSYGGCDENGKATLFTQFLEPYEQWKNAEPIVMHPIKEKWTVEHVIQYVHGDFEDDVPGAEMGPVHVLENGEYGLEGTWFDRQYVERLAGVTVELIHFITAALRESEEMTNHVDIEKDLGIIIEYGTPLWHRWNRMAPKTEEDFKKKDFYDIVDKLSLTKKRRSE